MAGFTFNAGSTALQDGTVDYLTDAVVKVILLTDAYTPDKDHATVTAIATAEVSVAGYTGGFGGAGRKALGSKTVATDNATDRTEYDAADPSAWTLAVGEDVKYAAVVWEDTNDDGSIPLFLIDFAEGTIPTNGGTFTFSFAAGGFAYTQQ
jgi:hypothetical protein